MFRTSRWLWPWRHQGCACCPLKEPGTLWFGPRWQRTFFQQRDAPAGSARPQRGGEGGGTGPWPQENSGFIRIFLSNCIYSRLAFPSSLDRSEPSRRDCGDSGSRTSQGFGLKSSHSSCGAGSAISNSCIRNRSNCGIRCCFVNHGGQGWPWQGSGSCSGDCLACGLLPSQAFQPRKRGWNNWKSSHGVEKGRNKPQCHLAIKREVRTFVQELGIRELPSDIDAWRHLYTEMGKFLAAQSFLTHTPPCVMELPPADIRDSKSHVRERAICDEIISLPLSAFRELDTF